MGICVPPDVFGFIAGLSIGSMAGLGRAPDLAIGTFPLGAPLTCSPSLSFLLELFDAPLVEPASDDRDGLAVSPVF